MIPTLDQMSHIDKEVEQKKAIEVEQNDPSSSMSLYNIESNEKHS